MASVPSKSKVPLQTFPNAPEPSKQSWLKFLVALSSSLKSKYLNDILSCSFPATMKKKNFKDSVSPQVNEILEFVRISEFVQTSITTRLTWLMIFHFLFVFTTASHSPFKVFRCLRNGMTFLLKRQQSKAPTIVVKMPAINSSNILCADPLLFFIGGCAIGKHQNLQP